MINELTFRPATDGDTPRIREIICQAQAQMRALGSEQWQDGYPATSDILSDLMHGYGWVMCRPDQTIVAYGAVCFDPEPAYDAIEGEWLQDGPYVVVHRLAVGDGEKGRGVATEFMRRTSRLACERGVGGFRVDTNFDNRYMLRLLDRLEFVYCGKVRYRSGERLAFENRTDNIE